LARHGLLRFARNDGSAMRLERGRKLVLEGAWPRLQLLSTGMIWRW
jgi:hypothetical protein